jgi:hypothetical protein
MSTGSLDKSLFGVDAWMWLMSWLSVEEMVDLAAVWI